MHPVQGGRLECAVGDGPQNLAYDHGARVRQDCGARVQRCTALTFRHVGEAELNCSQAGSSIRSDAEYGDLILALV